MSEPFRDAAVSNRTFVVCPSCSSAVEIEHTAQQASCTSCEHGFAVADAQSLVEHDAAARLAKALAPIPEETTRERSWRRAGVAGALVAPIAFAGAGILFGGIGLAAAAIAITGLLVAMQRATNSDPYRDS